MTVASTRVAIAGAAAVALAAVMFSRRDTDPIPPEASPGAHGSADGASAPTKVGAEHTALRAPGKARSAALVEEPHSSLSDSATKAPSAAVKPRVSEAGLRDTSAEGAVVAGPTGAAPTAAWAPSSGAVERAVKLLALFKEADVQADALAVEVKRGLALTERLTAASISQLSAAPTGAEFDTLVSDTYSAYELARGYTMAYERRLVTSVADYQRLVESSAASLRGLLSDNNGVSNRVVGQLLGPGYGNYIQSAVRDPLWAQQNPYYLTESVHQQLLARGARGGR